METLAKTNGQFEVPSLLDDFFRDRWFDRFTDRLFSRTAYTTPAVNISNHPDHYLLEVAAPGLRKEDFSVTLKDNQLWIAAHPAEESERDANEVSYSLREFRYGRFERSFQLPEDWVEVDQIQANYENGLLRVYLPKSEQAQEQPGRRIEIS